MGSGHSSSRGMDNGRSGDRCGVLAVGSDGSMGATPGTERSRALAHSR